ncbi:MAG: TSCPD domain-containing protein, partial [Chloroflexi bacterium]|nr:TSCPD domain-containing protein [Chloroflexota bacterium]
YDRPDGPQVRNSTRTTLAPTATLSIIANCSSGIEPLFALSYVRHILDDDRLAEVHPFFEAVAKREGFYSEELMKTLAVRGSVRGLEGIPQWVQNLFPTAHDIAPEWHVRMQAAFQRHTDNAVSKTVNFPQHATVEDVARVYMLAFKEGCKGITIYRDASRDKQVLSTAKKSKAEAQIETKIMPRERPRTTTGTTHKVSTGCGNLYITVNRDEQGIAEVFSHLGKAGGCASAQSEATSRLISLALRSGVELESVVEQLRGIRCPSIAWDEGRSILSCPDAIGSVLERHLKASPEPERGAETKAKYNPGPKPVAKDNGQSAVEGPVLSYAEGPVRNLAGQCPECSSLLVYQEGCYVCRACGYTKCG